MVLTSDIDTVCDTHKPVDRFGDIPMKDKDRTQHDDIWDFMDQVLTCW